MCIGTLVVRDCTQWFCIWNEQFLCKFAPGRKTQMRATAPSWRRLAWSPPFPTLSRPHLVPASRHRKPRLDDWNLQPHAVNILPIKPGGRVSNSNWRDLPHAFLLYIFVFHHIDSIEKQRKKALHLQYTKYKSPIPGHWVMFIGCFKKLKNTMVVTRITLQINAVFNNDVMIRDDVNNESTTATVGRFIFQPVSATCGKSFPSATLCCVGRMSLCSSVTCNQRIWLITQQKYNYSLDPLYNLWV